MFSLVVPVFYCTYVILKISELAFFQSRTHLFHIVKLKIAIYLCLTQWKGIWALLIRICVWMHQIFLKGKIGFRHKTNVPYIFPSLADGRYDQECVLVRLFNNYIIVLPMDHCEQFLQNFKKYSSCNSGE